MHFLELLVRETRVKGVSFLLIGGHAMNALGYARDTVDLDLLINKEFRPAWVELLARLGYSIFHEGGTFVQFSASERVEWPLDLMLVNEATFAKMWAASSEVNFGPVKMRIPSVEHLIAMKVHALKHTHVGRFMKDFQDVVGLIQCQKLDPQSQKVRQIFEQHGTLELYEKIVRACS